MSKPRGLPNKLTLFAPTTEPDTLVVKANYATGWTAKDLKVSSAAGRLAISVNSDQPVTLQYQAPGLVPGLIISLLTTLATARLILKPIER
ncbi:hypothetical protein IH781_02060 [Patescibacteria group bacterium]|nr:hypothetical protein [Patescibacteria group bacterium]